MRAAAPPLPRIVAVPERDLVLRSVRAHAANYSRVIRKTTQAITLHATDGHEGPSKAEDVAAMFARVFSPPQKKRSCTFVVDTDTAVLCVPPHVTAWHCGETGNRLTEGVELCGRANQTREQWFDALSLPMLCIAARLVAQRCTVNQIEPVFVDRAGLRAGLRGITTHAEISAAWHESKHTDPGPNFPLREFVAAVRGAMAS